MRTGQDKTLSGRQIFLEQCARLQSELKVSRTCKTANRYDLLGEDQREVIFILANEAAARFQGLPQLTRERLRADFDDLSEQERGSLMLGIKRLAELAAALPWEFLDHAAPRPEIQASRGSPPPAPDGAAN
ncbi:hypothetical protein LU631_11300 [Erwinia tracheiphila]|uniref:Uncharacterized protein n=1 Tax=Erwinia tracheiphila TaxID=65700 RepID=A0A0M2KB15_9GAMM|nr:hypothetical protein [Erwinia tracheiphila]AXF77481.1 hypothetical protein AV903_17820 [Erwinia tracheiphila]KKF34373.1 hypothetical protein SY86_23625 [Erwinia tracheiphila]KKF34462.1 hypothetical protein SY86_01695 [Erwinia tracheiphila]KKF35860.1 hypothetical protein SY86_11145 [Erwinia tracheiphila]UIA83825.1 hypothetical protein LU604_01525 [Erwinia tracheiphila]